MASPAAADERRELLVPEMDGPISLGTWARCGDMVNEITASGHLVECVAHLGGFTIQGTRYSNLAPHPDDPNADAVRDHCWMEGD